MCCNWLNVGGDHVERNVDSLCELRAIMPCGQLARKQEPQSNNYKELISTNDLNDLGSRFFALSLQIKAQQTDVVI